MDSTKADVVTTSVAEAVKISGISRSQMYLLARAGHITFLKAGRSTLVNMASLVEYVNSLPAAYQHAA